MPPLPQSWTERQKLTHNTWRFTNTQVSNKVENAFQALALDEPRYAFRPSLWERLPGSTTNLKQVWFPGNHGNVGGGWYDQQISDITLACMFCYSPSFRCSRLTDTIPGMCDQLSTLGLEFNFTRLTNTFHETLRFSAAHPFPYAPGTSRPSSLLPALPKLDSLKRSLSKLLRPGKRNPSSSVVSNPSTSSPPPPPPQKGDQLPWSSVPSLFTPPPTSSPKKKLTRDLEECTLRATGACPNPHTAPSTPPQALFRAGARPWALGTIRAPTSALTTLAGKTVRRPGRVLRVDETTNEDTAEPLVGTNERVHSCVRVRVVCGGLGLDDNAVWGCPALLARGEVDGPGGYGGWRLERGSALPGEEEEVVRRVREGGPREVRLNGTVSGGGILGGGEYPAEAMYPVGPEDHKWRWVFEGKVEGDGGQGRVPQVAALPEEPLVGYWERYLLALMVGEAADVWKYAQKGLQG